MLTRKQVIKIDQQRAHCTFQPIRIIRKPERRRTIHIELVYKKDSSGHMRITKKKTASRRT